jgi:hypothetical protein
VYHVLNRAVGRVTLFETESDYAAFERVLVESLAAPSTRKVPREAANRMARFPSFGRDASSEPTVDGR